jgi:hypothetical protein
MGAPDEEDGAAALRGVRALEQVRSHKPGEDRPHARKSTERGEGMDLSDAPTGGKVDEQEQSDRDGRPGRSPGRRRIRIAKVPDPDRDQPCCERGHSRGDEEKCLKR